MSSSDLGPAFSRGVGHEMFRANPQAQQFVSMISALYKSTRELYDPDDAALNDPNWWPKVKRDARLRSYIAMRLSKVARLSWIVEPASYSQNDADAASTCDEFLRAIPLFSSGRRHVAKSAFWGRSHAWVEGRREWRLAGASEAFPDGFLAEWWMPTFLRPLDKRQVIYRVKKVTLPDGRDSVGVETLLGTIDAGRHEPMRHPECLLTSVYDDEVERLGHGSGIGEALYHVYWMIGVVRKIGLSGLEKWAHGIVVAKVDANARLGADEDARSAAETTLDAIHAMRSDGALVMNLTDEIEVKTMQGSGDQATRAWLEMLYEGAQLLCLGALRPMGEGGDGSRAQGETEADSSDDLLDADREMLDEALTNTLVRLWWEMNAGPLAAMGLGAAKMPRFRSLRTDHEDPEKVGRILEAAQKVGMQVGADDAHRRMGIKRPSENEKTLEAPKPDAPPGFGGAISGDPFGGGAKPDDVPFGEPDGRDDPEPSKLRARLTAALRALRGA